MYFVYVLRGQSNPRKLYIGYTTDLEKRLAEHNAAKNGFTSGFQPWKIIYYEAYESKSLAMEREPQFKRHGNVVTRLKARLKV